MEGLSSTGLPRLVIYILVISTVVLAECCLRLICPVAAEYIIVAKKLFYTMNTRLQNILCNTRHEVFPQWKSRSNPPLLLNVYHFLETFKAIKLIYAVR